MPTSTGYSWAFEAAEGTELAQFNGVQRVYPEDTVIDEAFEIDGKIERVLGKFITMDADQISYSRRDDEQGLVTEGGAASSIRALASRSAREPREPSTSSRPGQQKGGIFGLLGQAGAAAAATPLSEKKSSAAARQKGLGRTVQSAPKPASRTSAPKPAATALTQHHSRSFGREIMI